MEYYSAIKRNELLSHEKISRNLKCTLYSARIQSDKVTYCMIPIVSHSGKAKTRAIVKIPVVAKGSAGGRDKETEHRRFSGQ